MGSQLRVGSLVGNPRPHSRTRELTDHTRQRIVQFLRTAGLPAVDGETLDAALIAQDVFGAGVGAVADLLGRVAGQDVVLVATPTYKAAYTGLLKAVLDLSDATTWRGTLAVPLQVVGSPRHWLAADTQLRPVLVELGALTPTRALVVSEEDLRADGGRTAVDAWLADPAGGWALAAGLGQPRLPGVSQSAGVTS